VTSRFLSSYGAATEVKVSARRAAFGSPSQVQWTGDESLRSVRPCDSSDSRGEGTYFRVSSTDHLPLGEMFLCRQCSNVYNCSSGFQYTDQQACLQTQQLRRLVGDFCTQTSTGAGFLRIFVLPSWLHSTNATYSSIIRGWLSWRICDLSTKGLESHRNPTAKNRTMQSSLRDPGSTSVCNLAMALMYCIFVQLTGDTADHTQMF
jgi:hypothetical protein